MLVLHQQRLLDFFSKILEKKWSENTKKKVQYIIILKEPSSFKSNFRINSNMFPSYMAEMRLWWLYS